MTNWEKWMQNRNFIRLTGLVQNLREYGIAEDYRHTGELPMMEKKRAYGFFEYVLG